MHAVVIRHFCWFLSTQKIRRSPTSQKDIFVNWKKKSKLEFFALLVGYYQILHCGKLALFSMSLAFTFVQTALSLSIRRVPFYWIRCYGIIFITFDEWISIFNIRLCRLWQYPLMVRTHTHTHHTATLESLFSVANSDAHHIEYICKKEEKRIIYKSSRHLVYNEMSYVETWIIFICSHSLLAAIQDRNTHTSIRPPRKHEHGPHFCLASWRCARCHVKPITSPEQTYRVMCALRVYTHILLFHSSSWHAHYNIQII